MKQTLLAIAAFTLLSGAAHAADWSEPASTSPDGDRFYAALFGGAALSDGVDYDSSNAINYLGYGTMSLDTGYSVDGAIGYRHENGFMLEGQVGYFAASPDGASFYSVGQQQQFEFGADGTISALYAMANLWYALDLGGVRPFAGAGVGYARLSLDAQYDAPFSAASFEATADTYAWQVGAGVAIDLTPDIELVGRYRYLATGDVTVVDGQNSSVVASVSTSIVDIGIRTGF